MTDGLRSGATHSGLRWRLLLPPGWVRFPADDAQRSRRAVQRLLEKRLAHLPRDQTSAARRALTKELLAQLGDARRAGASEVHALMELTRGLPVTAGLSIVALPPQDSERSLLAALGRVFGDSEGVVTSTTARLADLPALRRHRRVLMHPDEGSPAREPVWRTHVDWVVQLPDADYLVLAFSTQTDPVAAELTVLFDAIAGSLQLLSPAP